MDWLTNFGCRSRRLLLIAEFNYLFQFLLLDRKNSAAVAELRVAQFNIEVKSERAIQRLS